MESIDYSVILGIDAKHLEQLRLTFPTWVKHKPSLLEHPLVIFCDFSVEFRDILKVVSEHPKVDICRWPPDGVEYPVGTSKWNDPQRYKMLAGFVHVPPKMVTTQYWLKLDTDTVAMGMDDWIDIRWFKENPAIIAQPWGYTKPPDQILKLDKWIKDANRDWSFINPPLDLKPNPGSDSVSHKRIISWCSFFNTLFSKMCSDDAQTYSGIGLLPVPSQDGYHFYMATRAGYVVRRENMKARRWSHCGSMRSIKNAVEESMNG